MRADRKIPPVAELKKLYETYSAREIARMYGVSMQRIAYELHRVGATAKKQREQEAAKLAKIEAIKKLREAEPGLNWQEVGRRLGWSGSYSARVAKEYGIDTLKPVGCPNCTVKPYARGLCKNCYMNWWRRQKGE